MISGMTDEVDSPLNFGNDRKGSPQQKTSLFFPYPSMIKVRVKMKPNYKGIAPLLL